MTSKTDYNAPSPLEGEQGPKEECPWAFRAAERGAICDCDGGQRAGVRRLLSLDVLRGMTVFFMIIVNNGVGPRHFEMLDHSRWNGLTPCDLVFPFFLFMVGVSLWLSRGRLTVRRIVSRSVKMFLIGVVLHAWDMAVGGTALCDVLPGLRLWGVLQRIALCYLAGGCLLMTLEGTSHGAGASSLESKTFENFRKLSKTFDSKLVLTAATLLGVYAALLIFGNGYAQDEMNLLSRADRWLVGEAHLYRKNPIDPEGLLGTLSAIAHTLIGVLVGRLVACKELSLEQRLVRLFCIGFALLFAGWLLSYGLPLNKRVWSPSYVLVTCGMATGLLALLTVVIDQQGHRRWCRLFQMFGTNAFFLYILGEMLAPAVGRLGWNEAMFAALEPWMLPQLASLVWSLTLVGFVSVVAWGMWRKRWFVKI